MCQSLWIKCRAAPFERCHMNRMNSTYFPIAIFGTFMCGLVANVFVLAHALDPVTESVSGQFGNERNTLGMFGAGPVEMLAREMTDDLLNIQAGALAQARFTSANVVAQLNTKGVNFGSIV